MVRMLLVSLALTLASGCKEPNSLYCAGHPGEAGCKADGNVGPMHCTTTLECSSIPSTPVCDLPPGTGTCVQCTASEHAACTNTTPVCSATNTCTACTAHSDCASAACLPTGACGDDTNVAYVAPGGSNLNPCTREMPCQEVQHAATLGLPYIKVTGTLREHVTLSGVTTTILADPGAKLIHDTGIIVDIDGGSMVTIYDLEINGGSTGTIGISMPPGNSSTLSLHRVSVLNNDNGGIIANGGTLAVSQSTVAGNAGVGITVSGGSFSLSQSTVFGNLGGGVSVTGGSTGFNITNNFVIRNGNSNSATVGGASLVGTGGSKVFAFNTVVDNEIGNVGTFSGGVFCENVGFVGASNIMVRNYVNNDETNVNANSSGSCTYVTSKIATTITGLNFASPESSPFDYHLMIGSTAIDQATTTSTVAIDIDGDARPQGVAKDQGADEFRQP